MTDDIGACGKLKKNRSHQLRTPIKMVMTSGRFNKSDIPNHSDLPEPFGQAKKTISKRNLLITSMQFE